MKSRSEHVKIESNVISYLFIPCLHDPSAVQLSPLGVSHYDQGSIQGAILQVPCELQPQWSHMVCKTSIPVINHISLTTEDNSGRLNYNLSSTYFLTQLADTKSCLSQQSSILMLAMRYKNARLMEVIDIFLKFCKYLPANIWCPCNSIYLITLVLGQCQFCHRKPSLMSLVKFPYLHKKYYASEI